MFNVNKSKMSTILIIFAIALLIKRLTTSTILKMYRKHETPKRVLKNKLNYRQPKLNFVWILILMIVHVIVNDNTSTVSCSNQKSTLSKNLYVMDCFTLTSLYINSTRKSLQFNTLRQSKKIVFLILLLSGDINPNPGPVNSKTACNVCLRTVAKNHRAISCDNCDNWNHIKCKGISPKTYIEMVSLSDKDELSYICSKCHLDSLPFQRDS